MHFFFLLLKANFNSTTVLIFIFIFILKKHQMLIVIRTPPHLRRRLCNEGPNVNNQQDDYFSAGMIFLSFLGKFNVVSYKNYGLKQYFKVIREIGSASSIYI